MSLPVVDDAAFAADVLTAPLPVLVEFGAAWCPPCRVLEPVLEQLATRYEGRVRFRAVDADVALETVTRFGVRNLPTVLLFDRGQVVERVAGARPAAAYEALLDAHLASRVAELASPIVSAPVVSAPSMAATPLWVDAPPDARERAQAAALVASDEPLLVFKHSDSCVISIAVKREFDAFLAAQVSTPVATRLVVVQRERRLSDALAEVLQVRHESPQALLVQQGRVLWHASHRRITADALSRVVHAAGRTSGTTATPTAAPTADSTAVPAADFVA
ncbi:MAG: bacillithiol system redox-active protein YtxJ [Gemmatimonadetes bacterium]|nr:bacillithiol system redox-active protein YtxJ [Gemmatimonadota bacterium]